MVGQLYHMGSVPALGQVDYTILLHAVVRTTLALPAAIGVSVAVQRAVPRSLSGDTLRILLLVGVVYAVSAAYDALFLPPKYPNSASWATILAEGACMLVVAGVFLGLSYRYQDHVRPWLNG